MDLGVYPLAWCRRLAGEGFAVEEACFSGEDADTEFSAELRFSRRAAARIGSSMSVERHRAWMTIEAESGHLEIENFLAPQLGHALQITEGNRTSMEVVPGPSTYAAQLTAARATLEDGVEFPFPADDYVLSMRAIDAIRTSASAFPRLATKYLVSPAASRIRGAD